jgi:zinc protease
MRRTILWAALACACSSLRPAPPPSPTVTPDAEFRRHRPRPGPARPFRSPTITRFRLPNQLEVLLVESHKLPLVSVEMVIRTGSAADPAERAGLAQLTADMLDEGTASRSGPQIAREIATLGASLDCRTTWDASWTSLSVLSENLDQALALWADVLLRPAFAPAEVQRLRERTIAALRTRRDNPALVADVTLARVIYGEGHPYARPEGGTEETLAGIDDGRLRAFWRTHYRPNNAALLVVGDITAADLRAKTERLLRDWEPQPVPGTAPPAPAEPSPGIVLVDRPGAPQSSIRLGKVGIARLNPDYRRALVMNHILGGSLKRLARNLRETKGWTYSVASTFNGRRAAGPWIAGGEFVGAHTADAVAEMLKEVRRMGEEDVAAEELQQTKDELIKSFPARFATVGQIAEQLRTMAIQRLPLDEWESFPDAVAAVTSTDVRTMARRYLRPETLVVVVVGDRRSTENPLRGLAHLEVRDPPGAVLAPAVAGAPSP